MTKQRTIFILGIWTAILPFLGFPNSWKKILFLLSGGLIAYLAYQLYREKKGVVSVQEHRANTYTDNRNGAMGA
jgi:hypothetical protein